MQHTLQKMRYIGNTHNLPGTVTIAAIRVTFGVSLSCGMVGRLFN